MALAHHAGLWTGPCPLVIFHGPSNCCPSCERPRCGYSICLEYPTLMPWNAVCQVPKEGGGSLDSPAPLPLDAPCPLLLGFKLAIEPGGFLKSKLQPFGVVGVSPPAQS